MILLFVAYLINFISLVAGQDVANFQVFACFEYKTNCKENAITSVGYSV